MPVTICLPTSVSQLQSSVIGPIRPRKTNSRRGTLVSRTSASASAVTFQPQVRRATFADKEKIADLCAGCFAELALQTYPEGLKSNEEAANWITKTVYDRTVTSVNSGLEGAFSRKAEGEKTARLGRAGRLEKRAAAFQRELLLIQSEGIQMQEKLSTEDAKSIELRLKQALDRASAPDKRAQRQRQFMCLVVDEPSAAGLIGSATVSLSTPDATLPAPFPTTKPLRAYVSNMAVNRDYRRMGVAKQLLSGCETLAFRWGFDYLWLHVDVGNDVAESLYKSQGYELYREDPWYFGLPKRKLLRKAL